MELKKSGDMSVDELKSEIKRRLESFRKEKPFVFVSYSKWDCKEVYKNVLDWLRDGYNIYIDMDFENHGSEENWVTQMKNKIRDNKCVMAVVFKSENYCFSYASLIELLTMRSKETVKMRYSAKEKNLPIDVVELVNKLVQNGTEFSSDEVEKKYEETFEKIKEKHENDFLKNNVPAKEALKEGIESLSNKMSNSSACDDIEVEMDIINEKYKMGYTNFYPEIARVVNLWFNSYDLNGNIKRIDAMSGVLVRFKELNVYKNEENTNKTNKAVSKQIVAVETDTEVSNNIEDNVVSELVNEKKKEYSLTGDLKYSIFGEILAGNQADMMIMTFGKILKKYPEYIERAINELSCLSYVDYSEKKDEVDMPSYFRGCYTFVINNKTVCVGTAYSMQEKLKLIVKLLLLVGEEKSALQIEGIELPDIRTKSTSTFSDEKVVEGETYYILGSKREGNQSDMMWDVFEALSLGYAMCIEKLTTLTSVKRATDVQAANTKEAKPTYFRSSKLFTVNDIEYVVGTSYGKLDKLKQIYKMISICEAPDNLFVIEGEESVDKVNPKKKKEYSI